VRLIVLSGAQSLEREYAVFWRDNKQWQQKAVDADIQKLWATVPHIAISQKHSISPKTTKKSNGKLPFKKKRKLAPLLKVK
jgi:hypothetical protein